MFHNVMQDIQKQLGLRTPQWTQWGIDSIMQTLDRKSGGPRVVVDLTYIDEMEKAVRNTPAPAESWYEEIRDHALHAIDGLRGSLTAE